MHRNLKNVGRLLIAMTVTITCQAAAQDRRAPTGQPGFPADSIELLSHDTQFIWPVPRASLPFRVPPTLPPVVRPAGPEVLPLWEVAAQTGLWNLMRSGFAGGRVSRNFAPWIGAELFLDGRHATDTDPAYGLVGINAKFARRLRTANGTPYSVFLTAGVVGSLGLGYRYSPMIGVGAQTAWMGRVAFRAELQGFKRGTTLNNSARVLMGAAVGFGK